MSTFEKMLYSEKLNIKLFNIAMSKTFNVDDSEDLVQETYLKALERQDQFSGSNIDPWVITILKNLFIDTKRKGTFSVKEVSRDFNNKKIEEIKKVKRVNNYGDNVPEAKIIDDTDQILVERDKDRCLEKLSDKEREIIALKQSSSYSDISIDLDIKQGTIRQILSRAKEKFMKCMGYFDE